MTAYLSRIAINASGNLIRQQGGHLCKEMGSTWLNDQRTYGREKITSSFSFSMGFLHLGGQIMSDPRVPDVDVGKAWPYCQALFEDGL